MSRRPFLGGLSVQGPFGDPGTGARDALYKDGTRHIATFLRQNVLASIYLRPCVFLFLALTAPLFTMLGLLFIFYAALLFPTAFAASSPPRRCRCRLHQACWPSVKEWHAFNASVSGSLIAVKPVGYACHDPNFDSSICEQLMTSMNNSTWRASQPGIYLFPCDISISELLFDVTAYGPLKGLFNGTTGSRGRKQMRVARSGNAEKSHAARAKFRYTLSSPTRRTRFNRRYDLLKNEIFVLSLETPAMTFPDGQPLPNLCRYLRIS